MMNALKKQLLFFAAMCVTAYAHAGDNTGTGADSNQPRHCEEIKPARPYTGKIPANFKMLALCPDAESNGVTSTYTFVGEAIVDGSVVYRQNDILGK